MSNVKIINKTILLAILSLFMGCKENKEQIIQKQRVKPLVFEISFKDFGNYQINLDKNKWKDHEKDSIVYFNLNLQNIKKEPLVIKTSLVSSNVSFLIEYKKPNRVEKFKDGKKNEYVNVNIIHQFNTIYNDSLIFKNIASADFPIIDQAFRIGYHHVGIDEICALQIKTNQDTLDISESKKIGCIERKR